MAETDLSKLRIERSGATPRSGRARRRWVWWVLVLLVAAAGFLYWRSTVPLPVEVTTVATAYPSQAYTVLNATGYVVAQRKAAVASKATGRLEWLGVREGSSVRAGEVLARLESRDVTAKLDQATANVKLAQANLEQAQADLQEAERAFNRSRELLERKFVSQSAHDTALARYEKARAAISGQRAAIAVAQANVRAAQVEVEQTLIRAPFDGVVLTKNANLGDVITPFSSALGSQAAVVTMADMSTLEVEADVSEASVGKVVLEQPCEIQLDALPEVRFRGIVSRTVPTVDRAKATVTVKVRFVDKDPRILPEMSAKVAFLSQEVPAELRARRAVIQPSAVVDRNGKRVVFVVQEDRAIETAIEVGGKIGEMVEVVKGVKAGDKVVANPPDKLHDGAKIFTAVVEELMDEPRVENPGMTRAQPFIEIRHLAKAYRRGDQSVPVLSDITLDVAAGEFTALMGPSGSGKSTLLNLIAGIDKPDSGELRVGGQDITALSESELADWRAGNIGFIFQFYNLMPVLTAFENVELPLMLTSLSRAERRERVDLTLAMVGLDDRKVHYPAELSGGQQQRVAIARAIVTDPTLIVADEPTGDLDRVSATEVLALLRRLNEELGKTVLMVTHDAQAAKSARRLIHLEKGELSSEAPATHA